MSSNRVEPVDLDHYTADVLFLDGGQVRPLGSGFLVQTGKGADVSFVVADSLVDAVRTAKTILTDKN